MFVRAAALPAVLLALAACGSPGKPDWVGVPGGSFQMGSTELGPDERPVHAVSLKSFDIARAPVTFGQYRACVKAGACADGPMKEICNVWNGSTWDIKPIPPALSGDDLPAVCANWLDAQAYCRWAGGRLPTEAEWEYAARGGGLERRYPWGDEPADCARAVLKEERDGCGRAGAWPVCSKPAGNTPQGVCDMAGEVWQWVEDTYHKTYDGAPAGGAAWVDPKVTSRVVRGGSWIYDATQLRSSFRNPDEQTDRGTDLGFRCARSAN